MKHRTYLTPEAILKKLRLAMPVAIALEDPVTRNPITVAYENLHGLLVADFNHADVEAQVVSNLFAEMNRLKAAATFEAARAEARYRGWRAGLQEDLRAARKKAKGKAPTVAELEAVYRAHEDYEQISTEGDRLTALAGFFGDLAKAFEMKSRHLGDYNRTYGSYGALEQDADTEGPRGGARLSDYENMREEARRIVAESGASEALKEMLAEAGLDNTDKRKKAPRAPKETA